MGATGSGKSTLLHCAAGLDRPTAGTVRLAGRDISRMRERTLTRLRRDRIGFVFQSYNLLSDLTVRQNVLLPFRLGGPRGRPLAEVLARVGLAGLERRPVGELSGGQRQRVSIARALALNPSILLMDEPFGALDEMTRERLNQELLQVCAETAATVLFVTHSIAEAVFLSSRIVIMSPRPGGIDRVVPVDLPRPRVDKTRAQPRFFELVTTVRQGLRQDPALTSGDAQPAGSA
jgi:putative ABC transport system ATP-binding protein